MKYALVRVSVPHKNVDRIFHYIIPPFLVNRLFKGMRVYVPFGKGNKKIEGYIMGFSDISDVEEEKLKAIISIHEEYSILSDKSIELASWLSEKCYCTFNECLYTIAPKAENTKTFRCVSLNRDNPELDSLIEKTMKKPTKQTEVLRLFKSDAEIPVGHIKSLLDIDAAPITALVKKGILKVSEHITYRGSCLGKKTDFSLPTLTEEQQRVIDIYNRTDKPLLIHGVTGSGKTEVYLRLIEDTVSKGKQAIVLVPEIALTPQTVERFVGRFGEAVALTHSRMSPGERYDQWTRAKNGEVDIMIGPRSAIFTPFERLGIVIIDEEHESSYKAESSPRYDAREVALKLCGLYGARLVMGSATPSINSYYKTITGDFTLAQMKKRVNKTMPVINICDMRRELEAGNFSIFSRSLKRAVEENLKNGEQTILFLNRRGFSPYVSCRKCGYVMVCDNCSVNYTYHKYTNELVCHYCDKTIKMPQVCPGCGSKYIRGMGSGTEKIEEAIALTFPQAKILRMDRDTTTGKNSHKNILTSFKNGEADILVGTQMIAKGLDFPNVTLVGVIMADMSLNINDYRSSEVTFNLLTQVSGRAGRATKPGRVFIQTYSPDHYSIVCTKNNDYYGYFKEEIAFRQLMSYPPFSNIFYILITSSSEQAAREGADEIASIMAAKDENHSFKRLGPAQAAIFKINNKFRYRLLVKSDKEDELRAFVVSSVNEFKPKGDTAVTIALNPNYTL